MLASRWPALDTALALTGLFQPLTLGAFAPATWDSSIGRASAYATIASQHLTRPSRTLPSAINSSPRKYKLSKRRADSGTCHLFLVMYAYAPLSFFHTRSHVYRAGSCHGLTAIVNGVLLAVMDAEDDLVADNFIELYANIDDDLRGEHGFEAATRMISLYRVVERAAWASRGSKGEARLAQQLRRIQTRVLALSKDTLGYPYLSILTSLPKAGSGSAVKAAMRFLTRKDRDPCFPAHCALASLKPSLSGPLPRVKLTHSPYAAAAGDNSPTRTQMIAF
ncbi:hypothetical protein NMY22_g4127 [Coprinellus aureogranulatus]|nr:hypothetical protein NMY22_g4127 [Coprinellus aureogranulatus]